MTPLEQAQIELAQAYQQLEHAQAQSQAVTAHLHQCELQKVQREAVVEFLTRHQDQKDASV